MATKSITLNAVNAAVEAQPEVSTFKSVYNIGAVAALLLVLTALLDIVLTFIPGLPGSGNVPGTRTAFDWFGVLQEHWFLGIRDLGILNIVTTSCSVLVFYALYLAHRRFNAGAAGLALILICMGTTVYIANNIALPMLNLSQQYAAASDETQKSLLIAAGQGLLAWEDIGMGSFMGFVIPEVAGLLISFVMLRGRIFSRWAAWMGILGEALLILFNIFCAFVPPLYNTGFFLSMIGGPLSMVWFIMIARKLFQLSSSASK